MQYGERIIFIFHFTVEATAEQDTHTLFKKNPLGTELPIYKYPSTSPFHA